MANGDGTSSSRPRVVILARQAPGPIAGLPAGVDMIRVSGAYEAAAELLAAPSAALVLDLGLLWPRHLGLLRVARETGAEMLAFGSAVAGMDAEQLAGVRLISRSQLAESLAALVREPSLTERPIPAQEPELAERLAPSREIPAVQASPAARLVPAKTSPAPLEDSEERAESPPLDVALEGDDGERETQKQPDGDQGNSGDTPGRDAPATTTDMGSLLSPEELSALLGEGDK